MKKILIVIIFLLLILAGFSLYRKMLNRYDSLRVTIAPQEISADGRATARVNVSLITSAGHVSKFAKSLITISSKNEDCIKILGAKSGKTKKGQISFIIQSTLLEGQHTIILHDKAGNSEKATIKTIPVLSDLDKDGFPDVVEITSEKDRRNFRDAFVEIAQAQLDSFSTLWNEQEHDCAGLVRFAYREALKKHDSQWMGQIGITKRDKLPEVEKYNYPKVPILGTHIFRTNERQFAVADLQDTTFSNFAKGHYLKDFNSIPLGKNGEGTQKGDLLFFLHYDDPEMPFHVMIFVGDDDNTPEIGNDDWLVYHTGPVGDTNGKMKKIRLSTLNKHPDERWHAVANNPYFLGFYRWKILD